MKKEVKAIKKFYSLILPKFWKRGIWLFVLLFFSAAILLPFPFLTQYLIDKVILTPNRATAIKALLYIGAFLWFLQIFNGFYQYYLTKVRVRLDNDITIRLRMKLTRKLERIKTSFFKKTDHGTLFHRYTNDISESKSILFENLTYSVIDVARATFGIISIFLINFNMAIMVIVTLPFYILVLAKTNKNIVYAQERLITKRSYLYGYFYEFIRSIGLVKIYLLDTFINKRINKGMEEYATEIYDFSKLNTFISVMAGLISSFGPLLILVYGSYQIILGNFTLGALMAFTQFVPYIFGPASGLVDFSLQLEKSYPSIKNLFYILDYEEEIRFRGKFNSIKIFEIKFEDVSFTIDSKKILEDVSFSIGENQTVSLVGQSGSGKSSILRLIEGFWYPKKGRVLVGGKDTLKDDIRSIRSAIGYVSQETVMLKMSVKDNISLGKEMKKDEIIYYAKIADIHSFIQKLPKGYDTIIDPEAVNFSGGQLQRISLARALAHNKKILLLDEFDAEIDPTTQTKILREILKFRGEKTILIISHKENIVRNSDKIIVVDGGKIVEEGTYRELSNKKYSKFNKIFSYKK